MIDILSGPGMNIQPQFWVSVVEIIWINVLLSGDNAIVIALACRGLAPKQRLAGMVLGTVVALVLRVAFTSVVVTLMFIPYLKIVGGAALFWISLKLVVPVELKSLAPIEGPLQPASSSHRGPAASALASARQPRR